MEQVFFFYFALVIAAASVFVVAVRNPIYSALALLNSMSPADRADIGIKPADFPRIAREMSLS